MARTNESYLRWKFGEWVAKVYTPNVTLVDAGARLPVELEPGESAICQIARESDAMPLLLTDARLVRGDDTLIRFTEVRSCDWIERGIVVTPAQKATGFQRLIIEVDSGHRVVIDGLGNAVFPLLKFFWFKLGRRRGSDVFG